MKTLKLEMIVPGQGSVGGLAKAQRDTGAYLDWLIEHVTAPISTSSEAATEIQLLRNAQ